ncbi:MAG: baeRF3 domain-containing protein [Aequorivita sp.]
MNIKLKELKDIRSENCITIIMTTHRTKPDYLNDGLSLKKLIKEAEDRLMADTDKRNAKSLVEKLNKLAGEIDHSQNIESLMLFVNEDVAEYTRLPIKVEDRVVIDETFATRDLIRAMHLESHYYVLVLSQEKIRFIEALNGKVIQEFGKPFPFENTQFFSKNRAANAIASKQTSLIAEYFNQADKQVNDLRKANPLPVLICGLEENHNEYMKIADKKDSIYNVFLDKNKINDPAHSIVEEAWEVVKGYVVKVNNERKEELKKAVGENKFLSDTNEIWNAISEGKIQTLFIEQGLFQPAVMKDDEIVYVSDEERNDTGVIDDVFDEMIESNMNFGGDVVFLPKGELSKFNGFGAVTRY